MVNEVLFDCGENLGFLTGTTFNVVHEALKVVTNVGSGKPPQDHLTKLS